jgi:hypothetical protein
MSLHRRNVMREQHAAFSRCPFEHFRIPSAAESGIPHAHYVKVEFAAQQPAKDAIVEVFVNR